jgi:hypothetical protein
MSNNKAAVKAANTAYFDSAKSPNTITADQHAILLNNAVEMAWSTPFIFQIGASGNGEITFDNEDPLSVTSISASVDLYGRYLDVSSPGYYLLEMEDGTSITFWKQYIGAALIIIATNGSPVFTIGQNVRLTRSYTQSVGYSGTNYVQDAQFTSSVPQAFTASTRSLLRNDGLGFDSLNLIIDPIVLWDNNRLVIGASHQFFHQVQTQFTIVPSTAHISLTLEWDTGLGADPLKKTIYGHGDPIYICEMFNIYPWSGNHGIYLTGDKDFDVYGCAHTISINREG